MADFNMNDIRAAVAANVLTEEQAARLQIFAESRLGFREHMQVDDEPFELFKGFAEIFVTVGLGMLFSGGLVWLIASEGNVFVSLIGALVSFAMAYYFTLKRRMNLPSIFLATVFAGNVGAFTFAMLFDPIYPSEYDFLYTGMIGMAAMAVWFQVFKLPFSMFLFGLYGAVVALAVAAIMSPNVLDIFEIQRGVFDLNNQSYFPISTLVFGVLVFALAMYFDTKDPHRVSRFAASGFWLHVLAAVAIVNTVSLTLFNSGGAMGYTLTAIALLAISLVALVIDRRSFLTAGILYMGYLLYAAFGGNGNEQEFASIATFFILGIFITVLGTWWAQIRAALMHKLPDFPLKKRLPPYTENA